MRYFLLNLLFFCTCAAHAQRKHTRLPVPKKDTIRERQQHMLQVLTPDERPSPYLTDTLIMPIPLSRALFHDRIDKEQERADAADGSVDSTIIPLLHTIDAHLLTRSLIAGVDRLQVMVENMPANGRDSARSNQQKIQALRALWELLRRYNNDPRPTGQFYSGLVANMRDMIIASNEDLALYFVMENPGIWTLDNSTALPEDQADARAWIYSWMGRKDPVLMVKRLEEFAKDTFAAAIIAAAARVEPKLVFNYAMTSNLLLKGAVYRTQDPLVQAIVQLTTESDAPLKALPFLSYLYNKEKTVVEIDSMAKDPVVDFESLVNLRIHGRDTITRQLYTDELEYRTMRDFVRQLNELHDTTDDVRFRCEDSLGASALFYIMVYGREEIYTSSFLGTFTRMTERMAPEKGDEFLASLNYDHFRTFIRMCAGYNTLPAFLATMDDTAKASVMARFAGGLEKGREDDLEDAVNVADAIGSIKDSALLIFLQQHIAANLNRSVRMESRKGVAVYRLLAVLAESVREQGQDTAMTNTSARLQLPPVTIVPFSALTDDTGAVSERVFFYGDDDGMRAYEGFMNDYRHNANWKVDTGLYWATITSVAGGKHVTMYANKPLKAPEDEKAIDSLDMFLAMNDIHPTVVIHRGHSYHVRSTLARLDSNARIVFLGSCGGYQNVARVLEASPGAYIISSKQTGVGAINEPIIRAVNAPLREGKDINWVTTWKQLGDYFSKTPFLYEKYADYVPPHRNLGVLFIRSYRQLLDESRR